MDDKILKEIGVVAECSEVAVFVFRHHTHMIANQDGSVYLLYRIFKVRVDCVDRVDRPALGYAHQSFSGLICGNSELVTPR